MTDFIDELYILFGLDYATADLKTFKFQFTFAIMPEGGKTSECREYNSTLNKRSVVKIINDDNNCFWYSLAICMNPKNRIVKHLDRPSTRIKIGQETCRNYKLDWNEQIAFFTHIDAVEHIYNCNICVINLNNIPILGSSISLLASDCLM